MQTCLGSVDEAFSKDLEELLSYIHIQLATISSTVRALETIPEASMTMACNLELARTDSILKLPAPRLHEHDGNHLRRSGFTSMDLFSPSVLNSVKNKYERESHQRDKNWIIDLAIHPGRVHLLVMALHRVLIGVLFVAK